MIDPPNFADRPITFMKNHKGEALFYVSPGMYSIADLQKLIEYAREQAKIQGVEE